MAENANVVPLSIYHADSIAEFWKCEKPAIPDFDESMTWQAERGNLVGL